MGDIILALVTYGPMGIIISVILVLNKFNIFNYFLSSEVERQFYTKTQRLYFSIYNLISSILLFSVLVYICSFNSITDKNKTSFNNTIFSIFAITYLFIAISFVIHYIQTDKNKELHGKLKSFYGFLGKNIFIFYIVFILLFTAIFRISLNEANLNNTFFDYETSRVIYSIFSGIVFYIAATPFRYFVQESKPSYYIVFDGKEWKIEYAINKNDILISYEANKYKIVKYSDIIGCEILKK
jgi:uncharacterized membrane protein YozB (DUF420 family)